jgi:hypothetical protein
VERKRRYLGNLSQPAPLAYHSGMRSLRKIVLLPVVLLCMGTALAQRSGVLLGMAEASSNADSDTQSFETIHAPQYQTLWIGRDASGELKILASFPELIVPRQDGFWHVGVQQVCEFDPENEGIRNGAAKGEAGNESLRQVLWAAPARQAATVEQGQPCASQKPGNGESDTNEEKNSKGKNEGHSEDQLGASPQTGQDEKQISQCGFELVNVLYVAPQLISMSTYSGQSEDCEARGGRYLLDFKVRNFDSDAALGFGQLLGPKAHGAYLRALPRHAESDAGQDCGEPDKTSDTGWRIAHDSGRWHSYVHQSLGYFGCAADALVNISLPASLTGDASALDWNKLQSLEPFRSKANAIADAYASPAGDLLIAASQLEIKFFELDDGVPGKLLLTLPGKGIVMAQWATGAHVQDWTANLTELARQHLPAPAVRVKPALP